MWFFLRGARGSRTIKHSLYEGGLRKLYTSTFYLSSKLSEIHSQGFFPSKSIAYLSAPFKSNDFIIQTDPPGSIRFVAKWRGVSPLMSFASRLGFMLKI